MAPTTPPKPSDEEDLKPTARDTPQNPPWQVQHYCHSKPSGIPHENLIVLDTAPPPLSRAQRQRKKRARHNLHTAFNQGAPSTTVLKLQALVNQRAESVSAVRQAQESESSLDHTTQLLEQHIPRGGFHPKFHRAVSIHRVKTTNQASSKIFSSMSEHQDQDNTMDWTSSDMSQPFTTSPSLLDMDSKVRELILGYVLVSGHTRHVDYEGYEIEFSTKKVSDCAVVPYYHDCSGDRPSEQICEPPWNKDVSILRVNKQLYKEASAVLYGEKHQFVLKDAKIAQWWTTQLGDTMKILDTLVIELDAGLSHLCVPREKLWLNLFYYLAKHCTLKHLAVSFVGWDDALGLGNYGEDEYTRDSAIKARNDTIECLYTIRGLHEALITPCGYMSEEAAQELSECMVREEGFVLERTLKAQAIEERKASTPLAKLLATLPH
ncbi:hypothetical protein MMC11_004477 [Xylographa trunciseda]|nr:hypothetical protein [Xylographa trunciseda]